MLDWMVINPIPTGIIGLVIFALIYKVFRTMELLFTKREQI